MELSDTAAEQIIQALSAQSCRYQHHINNCERRLAETPESRSAADDLAYWSHSLTHANAALDEFRRFLRHDNRPAPGSGS